MERKVRTHIYISGFVQGVMFRANMRRKAFELDVKGWTRNLQDGRVEALVEGNENSVKKLVEWCETGPLGAQVRSVEVITEEYKNDFTGFQVEWY
jgi:acylphosphatase